MDSQTAWAHQISIQKGAKNPDKDHHENLTQKFARLRGVPYYKTESLWERFITWMDMHENPIIKHSISVRKSVRVFANPIIKYLENPKIKHSDVRKLHFRTLEFLFSTIWMFYFRVFELFRRFTRVCEDTNRFSKRNRVFYNRVFMHIHSRDKSPWQTFCFIIGSPRIIKLKTN